MKTTKIEEVQEVCGMCGGRGQEASYTPGQTATGPHWHTCRQCGGSGFTVTKRVFTTILFGPEGYLYEYREDDVL